MKTILILASNPRNDIRVDREIKDIKGVIRRSKNAAQFIVEDCLAVFPSELQKLFDDFNPYIVHFCGHGAGEDGLIFENEKYGEQFVSNQALSGLFRLCTQEVKCVLLNACTTEIQAEAIEKYVPYVIGTSREIADRAARLFAVGFYRALGNGESIEISYERGFNAIELDFPNLEIISDISETWRKAIVIGRVASNNKIEPLKILLKKNSRLLNSEPINIPPASPEFKEEIRQEKIRIDYKNKLRDVLDNFGKTILSRDKPIPDFELKQRGTLLNKVEEFWIEGFLKPSLYFNTAVDINIDRPSGQILRPIDNLEVLPFDIDESYNVLQQTDIKEQISDGKTLLILGEPGSGKTIALLQLAEKLIERTRQNTKRPIPVVFNLSSWGEKRLSIEEWLIEELKNKYQVPKTLSKSWIKDQQLTLLFDGLDEVKAQHRNACVRAINEFIEFNYLESEIVVCSRVKDYENLKDKLTKLSSAICIQPLSKSQLLDFLENVDDSLIGFAKAIKNDIELADFACSPLIFNVMTWTYQGLSEEQCKKDFRFGNDRISNLFESYTNKNLIRDNIENRYSKIDTIRWLNWLAISMIRESKIIFLIENMQPKLIIRQKTIKYGIIDYKAAEIFFYTIFILIGLIKILMQFDTNLDLIINLIIWIVLIPFGFVLTSESMLKDPYEITPVEQTSWSWRKANTAIYSLFSYPDLSLRKCLILIIILSVILSMLIIFIPKLILIMYLGFVIALFLFVWFNLGITKVYLNESIKPNQGIWNSAINALKTGFLQGCISGVIGFIFGYFVGGTSDFFDSKDNFSENFLWIINNVVLIIEKLNNWFDGQFIGGILGGFFFAIFVGLLGALFNGGGTCIQHFNLRQTLYRLGYTPWNYARFLNYATELRLMKKVGGGYIFYHRMLMEHFANVKVER